MRAEADEKQLIVDHAIGGIRAVMVPTGLVLALIGAGVRLMLALYSSFEESAWVSSTSFSKGYLAIVGIVLVPMILPKYVAQGVTRRAFALGSMAVLVGTSALMASLVTAGYAVEEAAYALAGNLHVLGDRTLSSSWQQPVAVVATYFLLHAAYFAGGWLIGTAYTRFGKTSLALAVPLGLAVVAVSEHLIGLDENWNPVTGASIGRLTIDLPDALGGDITLPFVAAAAVVIGVTGLASAAAARMTRQSPVR